MHILKYLKFEATPTLLDDISTNPKAESEVDSKYVLDNK
jgi:hypothetical protein